jgi:transcriptional regulator with PAS, ATPase and Fis domain
MYKIPEGIDMNVRNKLITGRRKMTIENIKSKLWKILKEKEVSLVIVCDIEGNILWHRGRKIIGSSIDEGDGFSKSVIKKLIHDKKNQERNESPEILGNGLSNTDRAIQLKTNIVLPINGNLFLYIDSDTKDLFSESDTAVFKMIGELLEDIIAGNKKKENDTEGFIGNSEKIQRIRETVVKYSLEEEPVLIVGETGVGKSHVAELIHRYSGRRGRFVVAEITSINENLFESIMFGHKKGSFTNAYADKKGLVQDAEGGTLFIDEVTEVPLSVQAKLLRFIETKRYRVLGEFTEREADVRIVAATNKNLQQAIKHGEFREDLYYRLQVLEIEIPPLRDRKEDIKTFAREMGKKYLKGKKIGEKFWDVMFTYDWPGNIRELITVLKRAGILLESPITGDAINKIISDLSKNSIVKTDDKAGEIWKRIETGENFWDWVWKPFMGRDIDRGVVKQILKKAYKAGFKSFKRMNYVLHVDEADYHKFMSLMHQYRIDPRN